MTEEKVWDLLAKLVASQQKTDEQIAKTDAKLDRIAEMLRGVSNNQGKIAEEFSLQLHQTESSAGRKAI